MRTRIARRGVSTARHQKAPVPIPSRSAGSRASRARATPSSRSCSTNFGGGLAPAEGGGSPIPTSGCERSWVSSGRWTRADEDAGAILCYRGSEGGRIAKDENGAWVERGPAWIYWSYADEPIFAWATRADGDSAALYDWFSQNARFIAP